MKKAGWIILSLVIGGLLGFFGVFASVFADGPLTERLVTVAFILAIYWGLGMIWGFITPQLSWRWGLFIGAPGGLILLLYTFGEPGIRLFSALYLAMIFVISCLGGYQGAAFKRGKGAL